MLYCFSNTGAKVIDFQMISKFIDEMMLFFGEKFKLVHPGAVLALQQGFHALHFTARKLFVANQSGAVKIEQ